MSRFRSYSIRDGLVTGLIGCAILFRSLASFPRDEGLWASNYDPRLLIWIAEWGYRVIFELGQPLEFWNANSFYPHSNSLAYSDSLLSLQLFYGPLRLLGLQKLSALYISLAALTIFACILSSFALSRIGKFSSSERILILISSHFSLSMTNFLGHYQLFAVHLAIPFFLYLFLYLQFWKKSDLAVLCLLFSFSVCMAGYLAPMLSSLTSICSLPVLFKIIRGQGFSRFQGKTCISQILIAFTTIGLLYFVTIAPYLEVSKVLPAQDYNESALYAAKPTSVLHHFSITSLLYGPEPRYASIDAERAFAPGYILTLFPISALVLFCLSYLSGKKILSKKFSDHPWNGAFLNYSIFLLFGCLVLALGPFLREHSNIKLPFFWLAKIIPGLDHVRTPGRFGMLVGLPLSVIVIYLIRAFEFRPELRIKLSWSLAFLIAIESLPAHRTFPYKVYDDDESVYTRVAKEISPGTPLLELPLASKQPLRSIIRITQQLNGSTIHWAKLFVGYGAGTTDELRQAQSLDLGLHRGKNKISDLIDFARTNSVQYVLIRLDRYYPKIQKRWMSYLHKAPNMQIIFNEGTSFLIKLN